MAKRRKAQQLYDIAEKANINKFSVRASIRKEQPNVYGEIQKGGTGNEYHARIYASMVRSPAHIYLSANACKVYEVLRVHRYDLANKDHAYSTASYGQIVDCTRMSKSTIQESLTELREFGFIEITRLERKDKDSLKQGKPQNLYEFIEDWAEVTEAEAKEIKEKVKKLKREKRKRKDSLVHTYVPKH